MKRLILISLIFAPLVSIGQLITTPSNASNLVQNVLLGTGVTVSNISYSGSGMAIGSFTANNTNLGLASGVVITTGTISGPDGPQGPNNTEGAGMDNGAGGYTPLSNIAGAATFNAAIISFDFVPMSDSVEFRYVFGSEEYLEYVNHTQGYNDAFAFFIAGPGIPGGQQNIAKLPNNQPVAIYNVHSAGTNVEGTSFGPLNSQYYVNNNNGATIQYDGFTKVLTARSKVQCGETYRLILSIADAGDPVWDSGIFLEANSLTSKTPLEIDHALSQELFNNPDIAAEGCVETVVTLTRGPQDVNMPLTLPIIVSGTATEGVDYTNLPASITFPAGVTQVQFAYTAFEDGLAEGLETIILTLPYTDPCGNPAEFVLNLGIDDINPVLVDITGEDITCPGEEIEIFANATGGSPPYSYLWSTGETTQSIFVSPNATQNYSVDVTDACLGATISANYQVVVPVYPPLVLNQTADLEDICPYVPFLLESNASGGLAPYTYQWTSNGTNLSTNSDYTAIPSTTTTYTVTATDECGQEVTADIVYTILSPPLVLAMSPTVEICPGDSTEISVQPTGGYGQYFYEWFHSGETTQSVWVTPSSTTTYIVSVSDECQTFTVEGGVEIIVKAPIADFTISSGLVFNDVPIRFQNLSQDAISYEWEFGDGQSSTEVHPNNTYDEYGSYVVTLIATDWKGCKDTVQKPVYIEEEWYVYVPNTFTPDQDEFNGTFAVSTIGIRQLSIEIYNRWGQLIFEAQNPRFTWDGTYNGVVIPDGTYTYKIEFTTNSGREKQLVGHVNSLR